MIVAPRCSTSARGSSLAQSLQSLKRGPPGSRRRGTQFAPPGGCAKAGGRAMELGEHGNGVLHRVLAFLTSPSEEPL